MAQESPFDGLRRLCNDIDSILKKVEGKPASLEKVSTVTHSFPIVIQMENVAIARLLDLVEQAHAQIRDLESRLQRLETPQ